MSESPPLLVLALGGHALQPPDDASVNGERRSIAALAPTLAQLCTAHRLLIVHGNGPQVGRFIADGHDATDLDIHTARTQGELGYLLSQAMPAPSVAVATRVMVPDEPGPLIKPIGPNEVRVASPQPLAVVEADAIALLLENFHVIAGGGGGIPLAASGAPCNVVVDKDWVALLLAREVSADALVFATDVDAVYADFGTSDARPLPELSVAAARQLLDAGLDAGSMAPKLASAAAFAEFSGKPAVICSVDEILRGITGECGTRITP